MATRIRLRRVGRKGVPLYRIVVAEREKARDGAFIAWLGEYNPKAKTAAEKVKIDVVAARAWLAKGATPSDTVAALLKAAGVELPSA
ncbi:MAG: 30S ribosomal protein S16 [Gemmatimonadales bacterium]|jgi:small subunit ribosomal protein S16